MAGVERPDVTAPTRRGDALAHRMPEAIRLGWRRVRPWVQSTWFLSLVLAAIAWPGRVSVLPPQAGLDNSWRAALAMAAHQQLPFGTRIVFTFGPLGFLNGPALYYANTAILAFIFRFGVAAATYAVLLSATRRYVRLVVAVPVAYVAGFALIGLIPTDEAALGIAFALCVDRLSRPAGDSEGEWKWTALGALAGLFALEKLSIGLGIAVLCAIAVWCVPGRRRRALALTAVPAFSVFVVGWFATGNRIGNLVAYARRVLPDCVGIHGDGVRPDARSSQRVDPRRGRGDCDRRHRGRVRGPARGCRPRVRRRVLEDADRRTGSRRPAPGVGLHDLVAVQGSVRAAGHAPLDLSLVGPVAARGIRLRGPPRRRPGTRASPGSRAGTA